MLADYHMHTEFSDDSTCPMKKAIQTAIAKNFDEICFTEHIDYGVKTDLNCDCQKYLEKFTYYQKLFSPQIKLKFGMEFGMQTHTINQFAKTFTTETRREQARASINERFGERENHGGNSFPGQREQETIPHAERTGASTHSPSEAVRSITERVQRATIEGRQYFKDHLRELIEKRSRSKSEHSQAEQRVADLEGRGTKAEQRIANLNTERSQIPNRIGEINKELTKHQSRGMER